MIVYFNNDGVMTLQIQHGSPVIRQGSNFDIDFLFETNCPYLQNKTLAIHFKKYGEKDYEQIEYLLDNPDTYTFHKLDGENAYTLVDGKEYTRYRFESQSNYNLTTKFGELEAIISIYEVVEMSDSIFPPSTTSTKIYATGLIHLYVEKTYGIEPKNLNISPTQYSYLISYLTSIRSKNVEDIGELADLINNNLIQSVSEDQIIYPITRAKILQLFNKTEAEAVDLIDLFIEDGDISTAKLADGAVTLVKLNNEVKNTFAKLTDNNQTITAQAINLSSINFVGGDSIVASYSGLRKLSIQSSGKLELFGNGSYFITLGGGDGLTRIAGDNAGVKIYSYDDEEGTEERILINNSNGIKIETNKDFTVANNGNIFRFKNGVLEVSDDGGSSYSPYALKPYVDTQIAGVTLTAGTGIQITGGQINATGLTTSIVEHYVTVKGSRNESDMEFSFRITNNSTSSIQTFSALTDAMTAALKTYRLDYGYYNGIYLDKTLPSLNSNLQPPVFSEEFEDDEFDSLSAHILKCNNSNNSYVSLYYKIVGVTSWRGPESFSPNISSMQIYNSLYNRNYQVVGYFYNSQGRSELAFLNMTMSDIKVKNILKSVYKTTSGNEIILKARFESNNEYKLLDINNGMIDTITDDKVVLS